MTDQSKVVLALALVSLGLLWPKIKSSIKLPEVNATSGSVVNVDFEPMPEPSEAMKSTVSGISALVVGKDADNDKIRLAQFYAQLSNIVRNEPGFIASTGQFKNYNSIVGQINFAGQSLKGKYTGLGQAVDNAIIKAVGQDNVSLDDAKRKDLADVLGAISWELWHGNP